MADTAAREPLIIDCEKAESATWSVERLRHLVDRRLTNPVLDQIEARRRELSELSPFTLHRSYEGTNAHAGQAFVTPKTISLPRRYGRVLYSISVEARPRLTLEAGAGLGISGMYLAAGSALTRTGRFMSFEIGEYAQVAEDSIRRVLPTAVVHKDDFINFHRHLPSMASVDLCFLDSKHDAGTILRDYKSLLGWMRPGGIIMIDDVRSTPSSQRAWDVILSRGDCAFAACLQNRIGFLST